MSKINSIVVRVYFEGKKHKILASEACRVLMEDGDKIELRHLLDALQRSVSHCVDELKKKDEFISQIVDNRNNL